MNKIFSSDETPANSRYRRWLEFADERFLPMVHTRLGEGPFGASLAGLTLGDLVITRVSFDALKLETTRRTIGQPNSRTDKLGFSLKLGGTFRIEQNGNRVVQHRGDCSLLDNNRPFSIVHDEAAEFLVIQLPRDKLEALLGPARLYSAMTMHAHLPTTVLLRSFLHGLTEVGSALTPCAAARMSSSCLDLIAASIAERMALDTPRSLCGTVTVQRAKAYIEAHLGDPDLHPPRVAAAAGVSQRYLHALFRQHDRTVDAWIWQRRLETAAHRLRDPALLHLTLSALAFGCGFVSQSHFSRRFRERYGCSPRDFRQTAVEAAAAGLAAMGE